MQQGGKTWLGVPRPVERAKSRARPRPRARPAQAQSRHQKKLEQAKGTAWANCWLWQREVAGQVTNCSGGS